MSFCLAWLQQNRHGPPPSKRLRAKTAIAICLWRLLRAVAGRMPKVPNTERNHPRRGARKRAERDSRGAVLVIDHPDTSMIRWIY
ncbi:hypothetical protein ADK54_18885 [Streptomyces sp. WM6378]|nr:hypothetical protein ADK54_18885 [Streptomyces sp. WM6378]